MDNLKQLTMEQHKRAERQGFARLLISGKITPEVYNEYLSNQLKVYEHLEWGLSYIEVPHFSNLRRHWRILEDLRQLQRIYGTVTIFQPTESVAEYCEYLSRIHGDSDKLLAHMYVRHFGDMYGGSIIKKRVPGSGRMYDFENKETMIKDLRALLHDGMADEAKLTFQYATRLFEELEMRWKLT